MADDSENFEVLDLSSLRRNGDWVQNMFGDISRQSMGKQLAIGGASGWCAGYIFVKVGKVAAATLGTTFLVLQVAQHKGYIRINWNRLNSETEQMRRRLEQTASREYPQLLSRIQHFVKANIFLAGGFAGGFLLGLAC
ncbi:hypothetical protein ScPMuIL_018427 [Solemya velum]